MTSLELLQFMSLLELEDWSEVDPQDAAIVLREVQGLALDDFFIIKFYILMCEECNLIQRWRGEDLLDAVCIDCGSIKVRRKDK